MNPIELNQRRILVVGANGGVGAALVSRALLLGHHVTAMVRHPEKVLIRHDRLTVIKGDILSPNSVRAVFENTDVVISAIGNNTRKPTTLYSEGARHVLEEMQAARITRCFFISASGLEVNPSFNFFLKWATKNILQKIFKEMYKDLAEMETVIKRSPLQWTIMRPPRLTNGQATGQCRFSVNKYLEQGMQISRSDLAYFMLDNIDNEGIYNAIVEVGY